MESRLTPPVVIWDPYRFHKVDACASFQNPKSLIWNISSFRAPPFPVLHHVIVWVYEIWDVNLEQNFTQYTKKLVKIAKKDVHFAYFEKKTLLTQNSSNFSRLGSLGQPMIIFENFRL